MEDRLPTSVRSRPGSGLLSPFLCFLAIDRAMKMTTEQRKNGIQWTLWTQLEDLGFADDVALVSHGHHQMQDKTTTLAATSSQAGLDVHKGKTKIMGTNATSAEPLRQQARGSRILYLLGASH